jgi:hypothetical protein
MSIVISPQAQAIFDKIQAMKNVSLPKPITTLSSEPTEAMNSIVEKINQLILEAQNVGVSPEKIAPLINSLIKAQELRAELKGDLDRSNKTLNIVKIDIKKEIEEYAQAIELSR